MCDLEFLPRTLAVQSLINIRHKKIGQTRTRWPHTRRAHGSPGVVIFSRGHEPFYFRHRTPLVKAYCSNLKISTSSRYRPIADIKVVLTRQRHGVDSEEPRGPRAPAAHDAREFALEKKAGALAGDAVGREGEEANESAWQQGQDVRRRAAEKAKEERGGVRRRSKSVIYSS
jgi:hypothetical protein